MTALPESGPTMRPLLQPMPAPEADIASPPRPHVGPATAPVDRRPTLRTDDSVSLLMIEDLPQVSDHVRQLLRIHEQVSLLETLPDGRTALERIRERQPDVLIIDVLLQGPENGLQLARRIRAAGITTPIVLTTVRERPVSLTPEFGIAEVLTLPFSDEQLLGAIVRMDDAHRGPAPRRPDGTFVVHSAKGGQGRSTVAHELAVSFAALPATRVALVDGDLQYADLRLLLRAPDDAPSIIQLPTGHLTVADLEPVMWRSPSGIDVLLAPPRLEQADLVTVRDLQSALRLLGQAYDAVVVDAPCALHDATLTLLDMADVVVSLVSPEPGALLKAARCRQVLHAARYPMDRIITVLNHSDAPRVDAGAIGAVLAGEPEAHLPHDPRLASGAGGSSAFVVTQPDAPFSRGVQELAVLLAERTASGARERAAA